MSELGGYRDAFDAEAAELFSDLRALLQEHEGAPAVEDESVGGELVAPQKRRVKVTRVALAAGAAAPRPSDRQEPILRFVVSDENHRPLHSFAIRRDAALDALYLAHPSSAAERIPAPAFADEEVGQGLIREGERRFLTLAMVPLDDSPGIHLVHAAAIRFEVSDENYEPLYSFTVAPDLAILIIIVAQPEHG